jgi:hypothetical protein
VRKFIILILPVILALVSVSGCGTSKITAAPGEQFTLAIGQTVSITGENLTVRFTEVISDSRCPQGVTCIWAGEASAVVNITDSESTSGKVLIQSGGSGNSQADYKAYRITFDIQPYPQAGKKTEKRDYRLLLTISKP